ncbi:probable terpene synthase 8 [Euphorbia lathyris]|uniref:probable terpene synthase 8 n=1 Tax=Euphorbia lathyris TaxID=212925 RepID=UPI00331439CD
MGTKVENDRADVARRSAKFPPTVWGFTFASFSLQDSEIESYNKEVEQLKLKVKEMLMMSTQEITKNIEFINLLCRLGVSYHFETEIKHQLSHIFTNLPDFLQKNDYDLHTAALLFRVLRQHGHKVPSDIFEKFKEKDGEFSGTLTSDVKGLLSLYEASFVSVNGEDILNEASKFSKKYLERYLDNNSEQTSPYIEYHIRYSLECPNHTGMERVETTQFISYYRQHDSMNPLLLKFAVLDYNRLQLLYRHELALVSKWWKESKLPETLTYARDRIVEVYVWALGCLPGPKYSLSRLLIAKYTQMAMTVDDTYDVYGTLDELESFTAAFERCNINAIDELPHYMKALYKVILELFGETQNDNNGESSYKTSYAKEMFKELTRADLVEARWFDNGYVPRFDEYLRNAMITTTSELLIAALFLGLKDAGMKEMIWVRESPKIVKATQKLVRLYDDVATHEEEQKRGDCPSAVECYMNEYGVTKEEATEEIKKMIRNIWKEINEGYMEESRVSRSIVEYFLNFARMSNFVYRIRDAYTYSTNLKDYVLKLFLEPLPL